MKEEATFDLDPSAAVAEGGSSTPDATSWGDLRQKVECIFDAFMDADDDASLDAAAHFLGKDPEGEDSLNLEGVSCTRLEELLRYLSVISCELCHADPPPEHVANLAASGCGSSGSVEPPTIVAMPGVSDDESACLQHRMLPMKQPDGTTLSCNKKLPRVATPFFKVSLTVKITWFVRAEGWCALNARRRVGHAAAMVRAGIPSSKRNVQVSWQLPLWAKMLFRPQS